MKILIATDGSQYSRKAVEKACELISAGKHAEIKIISAVERVLPMAAEPFGISGDFYIQVERDLRKQAENSAAEAEKIIREKLPDENISVETQVLSGYPKSVIIDEAEKWGADLIVVGSHGYNFLERTLIGSVSGAVVHHAPCSVLVVRAKNSTGD
jgi:nucleotide-binding universal stress UspA family protein